MLRPHSSVGGSTPPIQRDPGTFLSSIFSLSRSSRAKFLMNHYKLRDMIGETRWTRGRSLLSRCTASKSQLHPPYFVDCCFGRRVVWLRHGHHCRCRYLCETQLRPLNGSRGTCR